MSVIPIWMMLSARRPEEVKEPYWVCSNEQEPSYVPVVGTIVHSTLAFSGKGDFVRGVYSEEVARLLQTFEHFDRIVIGISKFEDYGLWEIPLRIVRDIASRGALNETTSNIFGKHITAIEQLLPWHIENLFTKLIDETKTFFNDQ